MHFSYISSNFQLKNSETCSLLVLSSTRQHSIGRGAASSSCNLHQFTKNLKQIAFEAGF